MSETHLSVILATSIYDPYLFPLGHTLIILMSVLNLWDVVEVTKVVGERDNLYNSRDEEEGTEDKETTLR
jgi:hypothetical protein